MKITNELRTVLDSIHDAILIIDTDGIVIYVNDGYVRITNVTKSEILGRHLMEVRPGSRLTEVISLKEPILHIKRKHGNTEYFANLMPITDKDKIIGAISLSFAVGDIYDLMSRLAKSEKKIKQLQEKIYHAQYKFEDIIGKSNSNLQSIELAKKFSKKDNPILIHGESGTGKELFAHSIHNYSPRNSGPFVAVNCATLEKELLESELFGYEGGAFTGSNKSGKIGMFEDADGGTIFLDEIGEMNSNVQAKLLRVLQEKKIRPVGSNRERSVDIRVICATNRNLERMVQSGEFREDLYFRIAVFNIMLPPLRNRDNDVLLLASNFLSNISKNYRFDKNFENFLLSYEWPGNIRELKNVIEYASVMTDNDLITTENLPKYLSQVAVNKVKNCIKNKSLSELLNLHEKEIIEERLRINGNDLNGKKKTAEELNISLATLYNKLKAFSSEH